MGIPSFKIINLFFSIGTFPIGSVKPYLIHFSVLGKQFRQLIDKKIIVYLCSIRSIIHIPRRQIHSETNTHFPTGVGYFFYNITFTFFPRAVFNRMFCSFSWPQAKTIVMLGGQNYLFDTGLFTSFNPLSWV